MTITIMIKRQQSNEGERTVSENEERLSDT